jgi:hypothetical protein
MSVSEISGSRICVSEKKRTYLFGKDRCRGKDRCNGKDRYVEFARPLSTSQKVSALFKKICNSLKSGFTEAKALFNRIRKDPKADKVICIVMVVVISLIILAIIL